MTDITNIIEFERGYDVPLKHPNTGKPLGATISVISSASEKAEMALQKMQIRRQRELIGGSGEISEDQRAELSVELKREMLCACIVSWDWGEVTFDGIGKDTPCDYENKMKLLRHPNSVWVRRQIEAAVENIENFTSKRAKPAKNS